MSRPGSWHEQALPNRSVCSARGAATRRHNDRGHPQRADLGRDAAGESVRRRAKAGVSFLPEFNPLRLGLIAAGGIELVAGVRLAGRTWHLGGPAREAVAVRVLQAGALVLSAPRGGWRVPLISSVIALRLVGLIGQLAARTPSRGPGRPRDVGLVLWLLSLRQLRREAARAEDWDGRNSVRASSPT